MAVVRIDLEVNNKGEASIAKVVGGLDAVGKAADGAKAKTGSFAKDLEKDLQGLGVSSGALGQALGFLANPLTLIGAGVAGLASVLVGATSKLISTASAIDDIHAKTGIANSSLQIFKYQGSLVGVELGTITGAITQMNKRLVESPQNFAKLGLSAAALKNMKAEDALAAIAEKIRGIQNPAEQTTAAMQLFGRSGTEILGLLKSDLEGTADEARRFGMVLSDETIAAADQLDDSLTKLGTVFAALMMQTAAGIATNETFADALDLVTKAIGFLAGAAEDGKPKVSEFINDLLKLTQAGQIIAILSALTEGNPTVKNKPAGPAIPEIDFEDILGRGMNLSAELAKDAEKAEVKAHAAAEAAAKKHAEAIRAIAKAYSDAAKEFGRMDTGMGGSAAIYGTGPMSGEMVGPNGRIMGELEQGSGYQLPYTPTQSEMDAALGRQAGLDRGDSYESRAKASAAAADDAAKRSRENLEETAQMLAEFTDAILGTIEMLADLPNAFHDATDSASRFRNALGGARVGGQAGGQVGRVAEMLGVPGGEAIGRFAGSVIGGIAGLFRTPSWIAVGTEAGNVLGVEVGEEMARAIEQRAKDLNISVEASSLLGLSDAIESSGRTASSFAPQFAQLMAGIAKGTIPAKEGLVQLDTVFSQMRTELEAAGPAGFNFLETMVEMAKATGTMTGAMKDFVKETGKASGAGFKALFDNVLKQVDSTVGALGGRVNRLREELKDPSLGADDKDRIKDRIQTLEGQANDAAGRAGARLNDLGILAAAAVQRMREAGASSAEIFDALGPAIDSAIEAAEKAGVELTGPFAELASQRHFQQLNQDLVAAAEGLEYVARAAGRSPEAIAALSNETNRLYEEMKAAAVEMGNTEEGASALALTPLVPTLSHLNQLAKEGKITLDEQTQALIDQAEAQGLLDATPQEKMLEIANLQLLAISALVTAFGKDLPEAVQAYIDSLNNVPNLPGAPGGGGATAGGGPHHENPSDAPGLAAGDVLMPRPGGHTRRLAEAGQAELAAPVRAFARQMTADFAAQAAAMGVGQGGGGGLRSVRLDVDRRRFAEVNVENLRRNTGGSRNQQQRIARGVRP